METTSTSNNKSSMQAQVARSRSIEWMVDSYNAWQQRSTLPSMPQRNITSFLKLISNKSRK